MGWISGEDDMAISQQNWIYKLGRRNIGGLKKRWSDKIMTAEIGYTTALSVKVIRQMSNIQRKHMKESINLPWIINLKEEETLVGQKIDTLFHKLSWNRFNYGLVHEHIVSMPVVNFTMLWKASHQHTTWFLCDKTHMEKQNFI